MHDPVLALGLAGLITLCFVGIFFCTMMFVKRICVTRILSSIERDVATVLPNVPNSVPGSRGIVTCAGGPSYLAEAYASLTVLRQTGCTLPVEIYHVGEQEVTSQDRQKFNAAFGETVKFVDATTLDLGVTPYELQGFEIKAYALLLTRFDDILFLDADCAPLKNPEYVLDLAEYTQHGNLFWPDFLVSSTLIRPKWITKKPQFPRGFETESGQFAVNKTRCLKGLVYAWLLNTRQTFFYKLYYGDKDLFRLGFVLADLPFHQTAQPCGTIGKEYWGTGRPLHCAMVQKCPQDGSMLFIHRAMHKRLRKKGITPAWDLYASNAGETGTRTTISWVRSHLGTSLPDVQVERVPKDLRQLCKTIERVIHD